MKNILLTSLLALLGTALAIPEVSHSTIEKRHGCLTDGAAHKIVHRWIALHEGQFDLLDKTVTNNITVEDESVNFLFQLPPGPYAVGKAALKDTLEFSLAQPGYRNLKIKSLLILHDCDTISFRWESTQENTGLDPASTAKAGDPVRYKGIDILEIKKGTGLIRKAITSADYLFLIYYSGVKLCFQKDAPQPVCSA